MSAATEKVKKWKRDPIYFVREQCGVEPDDWQKDVLRIFADPSEKRIAQQACAGPGKTTVIAWCIWNFMSCYAERGNHPNGLATSITSDNLKDGLWKELSVWRQRSKFLMKAFEWTKERIFAKEHPSTWFFSARSWSRSSDSEEQGRTFSGLHSKYLMYAIDESGEMPPSILRAAEQGLSNCKWGKIIQAGNPMSQMGMLYECVVNQSHLWKVVRITGDPEDPKRSPRIDQDWAGKQISLYGRDNPWVMAYILGQFPPVSINTLLSPDEVRAAMERHANEDKFDWAQKRIGVDAARWGDDPWVIFPRQGLVAFQPVEMRNPRSDEVAARVMKGKERWGSEVEFFDSTGGYASGAIDAMVQAGVAPVEVNFSGKAIDSRYFNKRSEIWFLMAEWVKRGGCLPHVPQMVRELSTPTYTFKDGKFRLESKEQIKTRLRYSPNYADALATTFALPDMPAKDDIRALIDKQGKMKVEYDPFKEAVA